MIKAKFLGPNFTYQMPIPIAAIPRRGDTITLSHHGNYKVKSVRWVEIPDDEVFWVELNLRKTRPIW